VLLWCASKCWSSVARPGWGCCDSYSFTSVYYQTLPYLFTVKFYMFTALWVNNCFMYDVLIMFTKICVYAILIWLWIVWCIEICYVSYVHIKFGCCWQLTVCACYCWPYKCKRWQARSQVGVGPPSPALNSTFPLTVRALTSWISSIYETELIKLSWLTM